MAISHMREMNYSAGARDMIPFRWSSDRGRGRGDREGAAKKDEVGQSEAL
jgi:hypothetical protein